jgi:outer membrane protein insertion porin family
VIRVLIVVVLLVGLLQRQTVAQTTARVEDETAMQIHWRIASPEDLEHVRGTADSVGDALHMAMRSLERIGYVNARITDFREGDGEVAIDADEGARAYITEVSVSEVSHIADAVAERQLQMLVGEPLDSEAIVSIQRRVITDLARRGRPLARISLQDVQLDEHETSARLFFELEIGERTPLASIVIHGDSRMSPRLVGLLAGLPIGRPIASYDSLRITAALERSGFVQRAAISGLQRGEDGLHLHLDVLDAAPGSFDLVLGYLPESQGGGGLMGSGHVHLLNPFGGGREFAARLDRLPGQASRFEASAHDPFVAGSAVTLTVGFAGLQQDSLYNRLAYRIEPGINLGPGLNVYGTASREQVRPGLAGTAIVGDRQRISRSDLTLLGAGMRFRNLDNPLMPRSGLSVDLRAERGRSQRTEMRLIDGELRSDARGLPYQRLNGEASYYIPLGARQVLRSGMRVGAVLSDEVDRADLIRIGGARSLRGYDEERFIVRSVFQGSIEVRRLLDAVSYLYGFVDGAYLERPTARDLDALAGTYFGFGVGSRFDAGFGLLNLSLAMNPTDGPGSPRIHAGVAFGL